MGRAPCCSKVGLHRGPWNAKEDALLISYIRVHGEGHWRNLPKRAGLLRCGKSCRLRWMNYLRPDIKRGNISSDEEDLIIRLHSLLGNRWSLIAKRLPGRTDNEIKNYWNSHLSKRVETSRESDDDHQPKASTVVKKRSQSTNEKKRKNKEDSPKTKIYLPKAVRVSPSSIAVRNINMTTGPTSPSGHGEGNNIRPNATDVSPYTPAKSWTEFIEEEAARSNEDYYSLADICDISFLDLVPKDDKMLNEIINEYQQLLNLEGNVQLD